MPFWAIAAGAAVVGFAIVLFTPRFFTMQRTAALPDFQDAANRAQPPRTVTCRAGAEAAAVQPAQSARATARTAPRRRPPRSRSGTVSRYAGKAPEEVVRTSDSSASIARRRCAPRAHARRASAGGEWPTR